ncbi:cation:proton antiporter [Nocardia sp. NPDC051030]|uniref:cation:proton antiporter n=1 Tax=Nocardia sp. NPDC051030 TaxID=3155162 RepID=UPI0034375D86
MLLLDLVIITIAARVFGRLATMVGQPPVVGEITAGILASPMVLGHTLATTAFPPEVQSPLSAFANVGVALFMFHAGLEVDAGLFRTGRRLVLGVSTASYVVPFLLGAALGATLLARHDNGHRLGFTLFMGAAIAVTAFPVLARILDDRGMLKSRLGQLSLASAALNDVLAWIVLAVVLGLVGAEDHDSWRMLLLLPVIAGLILGRPLLARCLARSTPNGTFSVAVAGALLCGAATEWAGLHVIFGAFAFGLAFPRTGSTGTADRIRTVSSLFLPAFFVVAGLHMDLASIGPSALVELPAIVAVAVAGKLGGTYLAARCGRLSHREAGIWASLMNARGLTELVILVVGLSAGLLDRQLYALMVIAALLTTAMTAPLLRWFGESGPPAYEVNSPAADAARRA